MKNLAIILYLSVIFLYSCGEQTLSKLGKELITFEISVDNDSENGKTRIINKSMFRSIGEAVYLGSNGKNNKIIKINMNGKEALIISSNKISLNINKLEKLEGKINNDSNNNIINEKIQPKSKSFPFNHILDFTANWNEEIYVMNLLLPPEEKIKDTNGKLKDTKNTPITSAKYIYKFNKNGDYIYKLGTKGKDGEPFTDSKLLSKMYCDKNDNLYLIFKSYHQIPKDIRLDQSIDLYRYKRSGELDVQKKDINKLIPIEADYYSYTEQIEITPSSENMIFLVSYYPKDVNKNINSIEPSYKKLFVLNLEDDEYKVKLIRTLKNKEKYYSLFGITESDEIYLTIPTSSESQVDTYFQIYNFQVLNKNGNNKEIKSLVLNKNPKVSWSWFSLGTSGKVIIYSEIGSKFIYHFYK
ncbi:MAG: hypothetical protein OEV44_05005 [Spirochaetota bacterium]|nr:hypothetical protein [Spirochaetota bacterium]